MGRWSKRISVWAAGATLCTGVAAASMHAQTPPVLSGFLRESIGLTAAQIATIERGEVVVKVLPTGNDRDVAVFGIITVNVARGAYVAHVRDVRASLITPTRSQFGIFSNPPAPQDIQHLSVSKEDAAELKDCRPGNCSMKLPVNDMQAIREQMNWSAPDVHAQLNAYARRRLLEYVTDYRARGDSAMGIFADRGNVSARQALADIIGDSPYVFQRVPSLARYLTTYPRGKPADATDVLYWSQDEIPRLRPIVSLTHLIVYTPPELAQTTIVAAKQIYANHYFEAGFELTSVTDRPLAAGKAGSYLVTLRRFRFDNLPGGILNIKGRAVGALRDQLLGDLQRHKGNAERARSAPSAR